MFDILSTWVEPAYGWVLVLAYGVYQVHWGRVGEHLTDFKRQMAVLVHAIRALGKTNPAFDDDAFDEQLPESDGLSTDDFLRDREIRADGAGDDEEGEA